MGDYGVNNGGMAPAMHNSGGGVYPQAGRNLEPRGQKPAQDAAGVISAFDAYPFLARVTNAGGSGVPRQRRYPVPRIAQDSASGPSAVDCFPDLLKIRV